MGRRPWSLRALVAAGIGFAMTVNYVALIVAQDSSVIEALPFATVMGLASGMALVSVRVRSVAMARRLLITGAVLFILIGLLAILTIGVAFLAAGVVSALGARQVPHDKQWHHDLGHSPFGQTPPS